MGKHLPRAIRLSRERRRLDAVAVSRGFENSDKMLHEMYIVQQISIQKIADTLFTPIWTLRKRFTELGISVKPRGGRNNVKVEITEELYQEACRDGASATADRIGVDPDWLRIRIQQWHTKRQEENKP